MPAKAGIQFIAVFRVFLTTGSPPQPVLDLIGDGDDDLLQSFPT